MTQPNIEDRINERNVSVQKALTDAVVEIKSMNGNDPYVPVTMVRDPLTNRMLLEIFVRLGEIQLLLERNL